MAGESLPVRGAWVEIGAATHTQTAISSLPVRGAWVEINISVQDFVESLSLPVRGAWVEIIKHDGEAPKRYVAPRAGSVG